MTPRQRFDTCFVALSLSLSTYGKPALATTAPTFERVLSTPCRALALDREPYVAALGEQSVTVVDGHRPHTEPLPEPLRGPDVTLGIFFGRDYRVRIAGTAHTVHGDEARYYRSLPAGLRPALDELGPLARGRSGLVSLLGTADPEIVCRPGQGCLLKRISGWSHASAPADLERVGLSLGSGWAIAGAQLFKLEKDWVPILPAGTWSHADDAFLRGEAACVVEHDASKLHHFDGAAWHSSPSPIAGPRSLWGTEHALWIGGDGGAALLSDGEVQTVTSAKNVVRVLGRNERDVWLCSADGVFRSLQAR